MTKRPMSRFSLVAIGTALMLVCGPAFAQQRIPVSELLNRLDRLEAEVGALNRSRAQLGEDGVVRLDQIELELRRMTGLLERLEYDHRLAAERAEKRALDFETRLQALEAARGQGLNAAIDSTFDQNPPVGGVGPGAETEAPYTAFEPDPDRPSLQTPQYAGAPTLGTPNVQLVPPQQAPQLGAPVTFDTAPDLSAIPGATRQSAGTVNLATAPAEPDPSLVQQGAAVAFNQAVTPAIGSNGLSQGDAAGLYNQGVEFLNQGRFADAGAVFEQIVAEFPQNPESGQAKYWLGDMHLRLGRFEIAAKSFLESFREWPQGPKAPDSLLKLGITLANLGQREEACLTFTQVGPRYPDAPDRLLRRAVLEARRAQCGG